MTPPEAMALLGIVVCPTSIRLRTTNADMSSTFPGMLFTILSSPIFSLCVVNMSAPERMPPTKVDMIKPTVIEIMPALAINAVKLTLKKPKMTKAVMVIVKPSRRNCITVAT